MLSYATGPDLDVIRDLKSLGKRLVRALADAVEAGGWAAPPASVEETWRGRRLAWRLWGKAVAPCRECAGDLFAYVPSGEAAACDFCPACWSLTGTDPSGAGSFDVGLGLDKTVRDLPPGFTMSMNIGGKRFPLGPEAPATEVEKKAALAAYAAAAARPLEIGRQVWMARMATEGSNGMPRDFVEARRWYEKAASWGNGEALTRLGHMALRGLGEPEDPAAAVAWWRQSAPRGELEARVGLAVALIRGRGVERDEAQGRRVRWVEGKGWKEGRR